MALEIALGIVLAVIILCLLPLAIILGGVVIAVGIVVGVAILVVVSLREGLLLLPVSETTLSVVVFVGLVLFILWDQYRLKAK